MSYRTGPTRRRVREASAIVTLRVPASLNRSIERAALRGRRSKSDVVREILERGLREGETEPDPAAEARRQSLLVSGRASEKDALAFVARASDTRGWR